MVLNLQEIHQPENKTYNIIVRNHRDNAMAFCCPQDAQYIKFDRWLDQGEKCTEINVTSVHGRTASIQLEDSDWKLIVSGNIQGGRKVFSVGGSRDFNVEFTADGHMILQCRDGYNWGRGTGNSLDFILVSFQK
ncbi:hypothetical protein F4781DRAFT_436148 [Annulohypoxylon bovei var. microspora]|nr:hypothetical protein F4781DRAFT_436148 [Annulohypoxylon bovei var. microspora]